MGEHVVIFVVCALAIGLLVRFVLRTSLVPYTVAVFTLGFLGTLLLRAVASQHTDYIDRVVESVADVDPEVFLLVFLPVLISQSAFSIDISAFRRALPQILILGVPGLLFAALLTAVASLLVLPWSWTFPVALLFGAVISATDPVAVVALMKDLHASKRLETLVEGESLVNDAVAVALFIALSGLVTLNAPLSADWAMDLSVSFVKLGLGGVLLGALVAALGFSMLRRIALTPSLGVAFSLVGVYGSYWLAEHVFAVSGIITVLCYALLMARFAPLRLPLSAVRAIAQFWEVMADQANTVLFLLVGVIIAVNLQSFGFWDIVLDVLNLYLCIQFVRFASIGLMFPVLRRCGFGLRARQFVALSWSGIRGAVGLAMALVLVHQNTLPNQVGEQILMLTAGVVLLSTLINGIGARPLLAWLGMLGVPRQRAAVYARIGDRMRAEMRTELARLRHQDTLRHADWEAVRKATLQSRHLTRARVRPGKTATGPGPGAVQRALEVERRHYWWQFQRGLVGSATVSYLVESVDRAVDLNQRLDERDTLRRLHRVPRLLHWLKTQPLFRAASLRWSVGRVALQYSVARGFALAQQHLLGEVEALSANPATRDELRKSFLGNKRQAYRWLHELSAAFPETVSSIETTAAARAVLLAKRHSLEEMSKEGLLDPNDRLLLEKEIEVQLSGLRAAAHASFRQPDRSVETHGLLAVLSADEQKRVSKAFKLMVLESGERLPAAEGRSGATIRILKSGLLDVMSGDSELREVLTPGASFVERHPSHYCIRAHVPAEVLTFPQPSVHDGDSELLALHEKLAQRVDHQLG